MDRKQQNQALSDLDEFVVFVARIGERRNDLEQIILRGRFTSGMRRRRRGDFGEMEGTPAPYYADPTGEEAIFDELADYTSKQIHTAVVAIKKITSVCKDLLDLSKVDVRERAERTIPDCLACGDPCVNRVIAGFDDKCYKRWQRAGRPDRAEFIAATHAKQVKAPIEDEI